LAATVVHDGVQLEKSGIAEEESVDSPPTENHIAPVAELVENSSLHEPLVAEISSVVSEPPTSVPEESQIKNSNITQGEDSVDPPLTDNPVPIQENAVAPVAEFKAVENPSSTEPQSEQPQIENDSVIETEEDLVNPPPTDKLVQEEADTTLLESKEAVEIPSTAEPSVTEMASIVSEPTTVVPEDLQIENDNIAEEDLDDPPLTEPSATEIVSTVSEPAIVPEELQIENDNIAEAEEDLAHPPPLADNPIQEEAVAPVAEFTAAETSSAAEPLVAEISSAISEPPPEDLSIDNDNIPQAEYGLTDPLLQAVETEHTGGGTEGPGEATIPGTNVVEDLVADQPALDKGETQSIDAAEAEASETHVSNGNGHSTTTQETIEIQGMFFTFFISVVNF
jgi:hypothetical protein